MRHLATVFFASFVASVVGERMTTERFWNDADGGEWPGIEEGASR